MSHSEPLATCEMHYNTDHNGKPHRYIHSRYAIATMQDALCVPVIDAILAPFKYAEFLVDLASRFGWQPSRMWGSEAPPEAELTTWNLYTGKS